jgi:beta-lactamase regulating signal transducer with metallopeptidase domain
MTHPLVSLGWTLLHFCWQAAAIAFVYWLADVGWAKASSQTRYLLALAAMLLMFASALATFGFEELRGYPGRSSSPGSFSSATLALVEKSIPADLTLTADATSAKAPLNFDRMLPWLDFAWLLGVVVLSARTIGGWWLIQRLRRSQLLQAPDAVRASLSRLCQRIGIVRPVTLRISECIPGPLTIGVLRSLIILPVSALMSLSPEQLEAVLAHELAHVRRADYFWNLVQTMVETLFFFHPAVWWIGRRLREERELCCDDVAVQLCADPLIYATALLRLEERRALQLNLAMALDGHKPWSGLRDRIARILGEQSKRTGGERRSRDLAAVPLVGVCSVLVLLLLPVPQIFAGLREPVPVRRAAVAMAPQRTPASATPDAVPTPPADRPVANPAPTPTQVEAPDTTAVTDTVPLISVEPADIATRVATNIATVAVDSADRNQGSGEGAGEGAGVGGPPDNVADTEQAQNTASPAGPDYIDKMRSAGYDAELGQYIAMKVQGITPEYAQEMANAGFGKPSAGELIAMKVQGITPKYVADLHAAGLEPRNFGELVSYKVFGITPEFVAGMKAAGFDSIQSQKLLALKVHGVTPEYAKKVKQQYPNATLDELVQLRIFHIDDAFLAAAKRHGFDSLSIEKLVQLRISGVLNEEDGDAK